MREFFAPLSDWLNALTGFNFSIHGYVSIFLALIGVLTLYGGLLYLMRLSHKSGADEDVHAYRDPRSASSVDAEEKNQDR